MIIFYNLDYRQSHYYDTCSVQCLPVMIQLTEICTTCLPYDTHAGV